MSAARPHRLFPSAPCAVRAGAICPFTSSSDIVSRNMFNHASHQVARQRGAGDDAAGPTMGADTRHPAPTRPGYASARSCTLDVYSILIPCTILVIFLLVFCIDV